MTWVQRQNLYRPTGSHPKLLSHASNPLPVHLAGDVYRIFYNARDEHNRSSIGAVDIDIMSKEVVREFNEPLFQYGEPSSFYSNGISLGNVVDIRSTKYLYFMGWTKPSQGHWYGEIGRLLVTDDVQLELANDEPVLTLDEFDPISLSYPWVMWHGGVYKMWYGSTESWEADNGEMIHVIKCAESDDGQTWVKKRIALPYRVGVAQAFSRPTVHENSDGSLTMWFSFRSGVNDTYKIGTSTSVDGQVWSFPREEESLKPPAAGWDCQMVEYPYVFSHKSELYMLYNGNQFGASGFGIAALDVTV